MAVMACLMVATPAAAEEGDTDDDTTRVQLAEEHYRMAAELYGQGRYREALAEFDRSLELVDDPLVYCNRAVPLIKLGELREAHRSLVICQDAFPEGSEDRGFVEAEAEAVRVVLEVVRPGAMQTAAGMAMGPVEVPPVEVEPVERPGRALRVTGVVAMGVGAGLGVGAVVWDQSSAGLVEEFLQESQGGPGTSRERHQELAAEIEERQRIHRGLTVGAVAVGAIGAGLWGVGMVQGRRGRGEAAVTVGDGEVGVAMRLRF